MVPGQQFVTYTIRALLGIDVAAIGGAASRAADAGERMSAGKDNSAMFEINGGCDSVQSNAVPAAGQHPHRS